MAAEEPTGKEPYRPPPHQSATWGALSAAAIVVLVLISFRFSQNPDSPRPADVLRPLPEDFPATLAQHEMDDEYWPCSDCHEDEPTNYEVRELVDDHDDHVLKHGTLWCMDCHADNERDKLHLANGARIEFVESWKLCTQCHGKKLADWEAGIHGKRTGNWRGEKEFLTCVECHDPHVPPFKAREPKPAPKRPTEIVMPGTEVADASHDEAHDTQGSDHE